MRFTSGSFPKHVRVLVSLVIVAMLRVLSAGQDNQTQTVSPHPLPLAGANRPANVPEGYVITPFGFFHPSCVEVLAVGDHMLPDRRIQHADGSIQAAPVCAYSHFSPNGQPANAGAPQSIPAAPTESPEINGWVEDMNVTAASASGSFGSLLTSWAVPFNPRADDGQVLYFFPGLEDINDSQTSILQPVLEWFSGQWTIASWNCCLSGTTVASPAVMVQPGDLIYGSVTNMCASGTTSCATWDVLSVDLSTGQSTILSNTPSDGQVFNWAFGGVLEAYDVVRCQDYPPDRRFTFQDLTLFDQNLYRVHNPAWNSAVDSTALPQCDYHVSAQLSQINLHY